METDVFSGFDWSNFHFIRPVALWAIPIVLFIGLLTWLVQNEDGKWKHLIAPHLRRHMFSNGNNASFWFPLTTFLMIGVLFSLALAGPTWKQVEVPGVKTTANMVILLDTSWSMMTEDISPNRLERAKLKINDLVDANPCSGLSLFVYAGTPHAVLPNTTDYALIKHSTEFLTSGMMPVLGSDLSMAMVMMDSVFDRFDAPSTLFLITDGISVDDLPSVEQFIKNSDHKIELLCMASPNGGEIPGFRPSSMLKDDFGDVVRSVPDMNVISRLEGYDQFNNNPLTLDKSDVASIAARMRRNLVFELDGERIEDQWQDAGVFLLIPALLLSLLFFRKGFMIQWCLIIACSICYSCSPDDKMASLWYSPDYRGQLLEDEGSYLAAAEAYENIQRKAVAFYKAGDFVAAAALFEQDSSVNGQYNLGLSLTKLGRFEEAQELFENLKEEPQFSDQITQIDQLIDLVKDERLASDSINRFDPTEILENTSDDQPLVERKASSKDEQLTSDTETDELPKGGDRVTDEVETGITKGEEMEKPMDDMDMGANADAQNIMLRAISASPAEFLRRRFKFQQEKYYPEIKAKQKH